MRSTGALVLAAVGLGLVAAGVAGDEKGTVGPWQTGVDFRYSPTLAEDRPNAESYRLKARYYTPLIPEREIVGEKGRLRFRVAPRTVGWAGIAVLDAAGKPVLLKDGMHVSFADSDGKPVPGRVNTNMPALSSTKGWDQRDTRFLVTDASAVPWPKMRVVVRKGGAVEDEAAVDFSAWTLTDSKVRPIDLLDGPTNRHGIVTARDGKFLRGGKPLYLWGGHENHVPSRALADAYAEVYAEAGLNVLRTIALEEVVADPATGAIDRQRLDDLHYFAAKLGQRGVYLFLSGWQGYLNGYFGLERGKEPPELAKSFTFNAYYWTDPRYRAAWKAALRATLTAPNPYAGGVPLKDDPTLVGLELANETGLNERRFDYNRLDLPEVSAGWREAFNKYLREKYGTREALARAWEKHPLLPHEDPAKNAILIPSHFRGARSPHGGVGQHDQVVTGRWYLPNGVPPEANPRMVDAIAFNAAVAKKAFPFDFNNVTRPEEIRALRKQFGAFLLEKYGSRDKLAAAWIEDPLDPWEDPDAGTVLIPTKFRGQKTYELAKERTADPRVSDALEFTYRVQKDWATDLAEFLKKEVGVKCGVGWNGDTFHVAQVPNHLANHHAPLDVAIAAAYLDFDTGDQITSRTKNLKRFTAYGRILGRPMFAYEWSYWNSQGPFAYEYALLAGVMGRAYGFDGFAHHKMAPYKYPVADPLYSLPGHDYITPLSDRPRRGPLTVGQWVLQRSQIPEETNRLVVGFPYHDAFTGGPERRMSNWAFENWLTYQLGVEGYAFKDAYDGPADRVVVHDGRGPYGDYRRAKHAILWCHADTDRDGEDPKAKEKWFALHGIRFAPGQKYFVSDQFFATTEDLTEYNVAHRRAEQARWKALEEQSNGKVTTSGGQDYWAAEPDFRPSELDRGLYRALKRWGYPLPFTEDEIDRVWRSTDRSIVFDTRALEFRADRPDLQMWFGKLEGKGGRVRLSRLEAESGEKQYAVALLPWDTGDFATAKTLAVWSNWNGMVTVKLPVPADPEVYAVNWLGKRLYRVRPERVTGEGVTFATARDDDVFCYEVVR